MINGDHKRVFLSALGIKRGTFFGSIVAEMWGNICNFEDIKKNT